ncbi:hypothetical protein BH09BAC3_BH09BAC3_17910 [soil metagenome]
MRIYFLLVFAFLSFCIYGQAQNAQETEVYLIGFRITALEKKGGNLYKITIPYGLNAGIKSGKNVTCYGKIRDEVKNHNHELGKGVLSNVSQNETSVEITLNENEAVYVGDLLYTNCSVPKLIRTSYFFLTTEAISVTNDDGEPYYTFEEIFNKDGYALRKQKFLAMQKDIQASGERLKQSGNKSVVQAGPNAGQLVSEVLITTDTMAVWYYVYHLGQMSWDTMGQTYKLSENYQKYVEEGDAASSALLKTLFVGMSEKDMESRFSQYKRKITKELLETWKDSAYKLKADKKYDEAIQLLATAAFLAKKIGETYNEGVYLFSIGESYDNQSLYEKSVEYYAKAVPLLERTANPFTIAYAYFNFAYACKEAKLYKEAGVHIDKSIELRTKLVKDNPTNTDYMDNLCASLEVRGAIYEATNDIPNALEAYKLSLQAAQASKNKKNEGNAYWNLAYAYENGLKDHAQSAIAYSKAADVYLESKDTANAIILIRSLGVVNLNDKNVKNAKEEVARGVALARSWKSDKYLPYILNYQGTMFYDLKEYENSFKSFGEAEAIYRRTGETQKLLDVIKAYGKSLRDAGKNKEALAKHLERVPLRKAGDLSEEGDMEWDLATICGNLKDSKCETLHYQRSEQIYLQLKDSAKVTTLMNNLGYTYRDMRDSVNSYKNHTRAIAFDKSRNNNAALANSYEHFAYSYKSFKNWRKSIENYKLAAEYYKKDGNALKEANMIDEQAQRNWDWKKFPEAIALAKQSISFYNKLENKNEEGMAWWDLSYQLGESMQNYDESIAGYEVAFKLFMADKDSVDASTMLSNIGQTYWSKLNYEKAIEYHQAAIALAKKCRNDKQVAKSWLKLSLLYKESNNPVVAAEALFNAAEALATVNDSTLLGSTYQDLANSYSKSKDYPKAIAFFNKSIVVRSALKDTVNLSSAIVDLAGVYHTKNDYKNAEQFYLQSLALRKKTKDKVGEMYTLVGLGNLEENVSTNYVKSEKYFLEAEKLAKEGKDDYLLAYIYGQMKWLYRSQGKPALAEANVKKSLELYRKQKNSKEIANTLVSMSFDASYVSGDQPRALKLLDDAQKIADTLNDVSVQASVYSQRSSILREMGEFQQALEYSRKSMTLNKEIDNEWGMAGVFIDEGNIYKQLGDFDEAMKSQMKADSVYLKINAEYPRLAPLANIGENYSAQGDYVKAKEYYQKSLAIMVKAKDNNENLAIMQGSMGEVNFYMGNYAEAENWLKISLVTCDKVGAMRPKADNLSAMGRLKIEEKKYDEAKVFLSEGLRLSKEKSMRITYLNNLVLLGKLEVERKNFAAAKPLLEEAIKAAREMNKLGSMWESLYLTGVMYKDTKDLAKSAEYLKEAAAVIEKLRNKVSGGEEARKLFSSDKNISKVSEVLVDVLLQLGETELAMSYLQKANEDNIKAKYRSLDIKFQDEEKNQVVGQERTMKAKLDGIEQQISKEKALPVDKQNVTKLKNLEGIQSIAEGDYLKFVNQQVNVQPELSKFFSNSVQPSEFRKRKKQIPKDMALLSYLPGEKQLYIFMATNDTVIAKVVNVTREQLGRDVNGVMSIVKTQQGKFGKIDLNKEAQEREELVGTVKQTDKMMIPFEELYHFLISPVASEISGKKKLCIIPNGALSYIPFQLLGKTLSNGKFSLLANQFSIFYANSTDMLLRTLEAGDKDYNILAFGNPDKSLPSTEKEVSDIKKLFPNASIYTRDEATEDKAKFAGANFNVMHFATHGNLDYEDFSKSYLTMAGNPSKNEDGKLTLEELWGMEVMNHLNIVVLSACQTAVTKGSNESSPVSPASGFLQNGVKSVVATLWKVDDEATSILINDFYKNIKTMDAVDALRTAQVNLSNNPKFSMPYYWAGAILLGDWR